MRLNFGVRLRHQQEPARAPVQPGFQAAVARPTLRLRKPTVGGRICSPAGAADKWFNSNSAPQQLLVSADWRPRISAARATTAVFPQHLVEPPTSCSATRANELQTASKAGYPAPPTSGAGNPFETRIHSSGTPPSGLRRRAASRIRVADRSTAAPIQLRCGSRQAAEHRRRTSGSTRRRTCFRDVAARAQDPHPLRHTARKPLSYSSFA
jgi:hypothetical protein